METNELLHENNMEEEKTEDVLQALRNDEKLYSKLYPHQCDGILFLINAYKNGKNRSNGSQKGAILADEMGLGKSIQVIVFLHNMIMNTQEFNNAMIVVPAGLLNDWKDKLNNWTPKITLLLYRNNGKTLPKKLSHLRKSGGILLVSYQTLLYNYKTLTTNKDKPFVWDCLVFDEAHKLKNPDSKSHKAAALISAGFRVLMTGTPMHNNLKEYWTLFSLISDTFLLGTYKTFKTSFENPITKGMQSDSGPEERALGIELQERLRKITKPFLLRRRKDEIQNSNAQTLSENIPSEQVLRLPKKNEYVVWISLSPEQEAAYRSILDESSSLTFQSIHSLLAVCTHPQSNSDITGHEMSGVHLADSGKLAFMLALLKTLTANGNFVLVFSNYIKTLDIIQNALTQTTWGRKAFLRIDGQNINQRDTIVRRFQKKRSENILLLTTSVGAEGLTLTAADSVVFADLSWNQSLDAQAVGRAHRIGQTKEVKTYRLITCGTLEETMYRRQLFKGSLTRQAMGDEQNPLRHFTQEELKAMLTLQETRFSSTQQQLKNQGAKILEITEVFGEVISSSKAASVVGISDHGQLLSASQGEDLEVEMARMHITENVKICEQEIEAEFHLTRQQVYNDVSVKKSFRKAQIRRTPGLPRKYKCFNTPFSGTKRKSLHISRPCVFESSVDSTNLSADDEVNLSAKILHNYPDLDIDPSHGPNLNMNASFVTDLDENGSPVTELDEGLIPAPVPLSQSACQAHTSMQDNSVSVHYTSNSPNYRTSVSTMEDHFLNTQSKEDYINKSETSHLLEANISAKISSIRTSVFDISLVQPSETEMNSQDGKFKDSGLQKTQMNSEHNGTVCAKTSLNLNSNSSEDTYILALPSNTQKDQKLQQSSKDPEVNVAKVHLEDTITNWHEETEAESDFKRQSCLNVDSRKPDRKAKIRRWSYETTATCLPRNYKYNTSLLSCTRRKTTHISRPSVFESVDSYSLSADEEQTCENAIHHISVTAKTEKRFNIFSPCSAAALICNSNLSKDNSSRAELRYESSCYDFENSGRPSSCNTSIGSFVNKSFSGDILHMKENDKVGHDGQTDDKLYLSAVSNGQRNNFGDNIMQNSESEEMASFHEETNQKGVKSAEAAQQQTLLKQDETGQRDTSHFSEHHISKTQQSSDMDIYNKDLSAVAKMLLKTSTDHEHIIHPSIDKSLLDSADNTSKNCSDLHHKSVFASTDDSYASAEENYIIKDETRCLQEVNNLFVNTTIPLGVCRFMTEISLVQSSEAEKLSDLEEESNQQKLQMQMNAEYEERVPLIPLNLNTLFCEYPNHSIAPGSEPSSESQKKVTPSHKRQDIQQADTRCENIKTALKSSQDVPVLCDYSLTPSCISSCGTPPAGKEQQNIELKQLGECNELIVLKDEESLEKITFSEPKGQQAIEVDKLADLEEEPTPQLAKFIEHGELHIQTNNEYSFHLMPLNLNSLLCEHSPHSTTPESQPTCASQKKTIIGLKRQKLQLAITGCENVKTALKNNQVVPVLCDYSLTPSCMSLCGTPSPGKGQHNIKLKQLVECDVIKEEGSPQEVTYAEPKGHKDDSKYANEELIYPMPFLDLSRHSEFYEHINVPLLVCESAKSSSEMEMNIKDDELAYIIQEDSLKSGLNSNQITPVNKYSFTPGCVSLLGTPCVEKEKHVLSEHFQSTPLQSGQAVRRLPFSRFHPRAKSNRGTPVKSSPEGKLDISSHLKRRKTGTPGLVPKYKCFSPSLVKTGRRKTVSKMNAVFSELFSFNNASLIKALRHLFIPKLQHKKKRRYCSKSKFKRHNLSGNYRNYRKKLLKSIKNVDKNQLLVAKSDIYIACSPEPTKEKSPDQNVQSNGISEGESEQFTKAVKVDVKPVHGLCTQDCFEKTAKCHPILNECISTSGTHSKPQECSTPKHSACLEDDHKLHSTSDNGFFSLSPILSVYKTNSEMFNDQTQVSTYDHTYTMHAEVIRKSSGMRNQTNEMEISIPNKMSIEKFSKSELGIAFKSNKDCCFIAENEDDFNDSAEQVLSPQQTLVKYNAHRPSMQIMITSKGNYEIKGFRDVAQFHNQTDMASGEIQSCAQDGYYPETSNCRIAPPSDIQESHIAPHGGKQNNANSGKETNLQSDVEDNINKMLCLLDKLKTL